MGKKPSLETENKTLRRRVRELESDCSQLRAENRRLANGWNASAKDAISLREDLKGWRERFDTLLKLKASGKETP